MSETDYMKERPPKTIFPIEKQMMILDQIKEYVYDHLLQKTKIHRMRLFGSLAKGTFGKYDGTWKGRKYSDVDVLFVVDDNFIVPREWKIHFEPKGKEWIVYDIATVPVTTIDETAFVEVQYIVVPISSARKLETIALAEKWGIPLKRFLSKHKFIRL